MGNRTIHSKYLFNDFEVPDNYYPPIIIADNLKTPENLGNILRLADNIRSENVIFVDSDPNLRLSKVKKTASSSFKSVNWEFCSFTEIKNKIPSDYTLIAIETTSDSENIFKSQLPDKVAFMVVGFGEIISISGILPFSSRSQLFKVLIICVPIFSISF